MTNPFIPSASATPSVKNRWRDLQVCSGISIDDVDACLVHYEHIIRRNRWDDTIKLDNVVLFLYRMALSWFDNHGVGIPSWDTFKTTHCDVFPMRSGTINVRMNCCLGASKLSMKHGRPTLKTFFVSTVMWILTCQKKTDYDNFLMHFT